MWCCGVVEIVKTRYEKVIKVDIKWDKHFVACGEREKMEGALKKHLCNPSTPRKGARRQDAREYLRTI